jgi:O-acetyl-ADP-ribose deacetylase
VPRNFTDRIGLVVGDITGLQVDAIVTAANESLSGGGGVDGAVHRAAGPALFEECRTIGICPEGQARITGGYLLPARFVIHAVGPVYEDGSFGEAGILASAYRESLALAEANGIGTIAFPCIATGVYGYPKPEACRVAVEVVMSWLTGHDLPNRVTFCCFDEADAEVYRAQLDEIEAIT